MQQNSSGVYSSRFCRLNQSQNPLKTFHIFQYQTIKETTGQVLKYVNIVSQSPVCNIYAVRTHVKQHELFHIKLDV